MALNLDATIDSDGMVAVLMRWTDLGVDSRRQVAESLKTGVVAKKKESTPRSLFLNSWKHGPTLPDLASADS